MNYMYTCTEVKKNKVEMFFCNKNSDKRRLGGCGWALKLWAGFKGRMLAALTYCACAQLAWRIRRSSALQRKCTTLK